MKLYEIAEAFGELLWSIGEAIDRGDEEEVKKQFDKLQTIKSDFGTKAEALVMYCKNEEAEAKALKEEADRLTKRAKACETKVRNMKEYLKHNMEYMGITKANAGIFKLSIQQSGGLQPMQIDCDASELPEKFQKVTITADTDAIRRFLETGGQSDQFRLLERGTSFRIR